eukprot:352672-Chlamydomonas_euryale.AAC.5
MSTRASGGRQGRRHANATQRGMARAYRRRCPTSALKRTCTALPLWGCGMGRKREGKGEVKERGLGEREQTGRGRDQGELIVCKGRVRQSGVHTCPSTPRRKQAVDDAAALEDAAELVAWALRRHVQGHEVRSQLTPGPCSEAL